MSDQVASVAVRDAIPGDWSFVFATFLRGLYYGDSWFSKIPKNIFMQNYHAILERILGYPSTKVRVVCLKDDPEVVLGYSILSTNETILHWVFVKRPWRKIGLGRLLVPNTVTSVTHLTSLGETLMKKNPGCVFNPFII